MEIPAAALDSHIGILGRTGSGKSFTARGLVERLLEAGRHTCVIDPTGAWFGIRSNAGGTGPGFPIPIFGGLHGDVPINDGAGAAVARVILSQTTSAVVDLSLLSGAAQRRFMTGFVAELRAKPRGSFWLVIDEADEFMPQLLPPDMTHLFGDLKWIVRRGRIAGFRVMMITQRPAEIAKAMLTQIGTLVAHRLTAPQDRRAIEEWVKGHADPEQAREVLSTLAGLAVGEAWLWAPDLNLLERMRMPPIATFDSGRTPEPDETIVAQPEIAALDLTDLRAALLEDDPKAAPAEPAAASHCAGLLEDMKKENAELAAAFGECNAALQALRAAVAASIATLQAAEPADGVAVPAAEAAVPAAAQPARPAAPAQAKSRDPLTPGGERLIATFASVYPKAITMQQAAALAGVSVTSSQWRANRNSAQSSGLIESTGGHSIDDWLRVLSPAAGRILQALRAFPDIDRQQISDYASISPTSSGLGSALRELISNGLAQKIGNTYRATEAAL